MKLTDIGYKATPQKLNKVMESRFGFAIDYASLTMEKAQRLSSALSENLNKIRHSYGIHSAEKNPKYMELLMVREGLTQWINSNQVITESEMAKSEAILAAKDMVDSIQDMLEDVSKMQNEQLPALLDTIRDQIGTEKADAFKGQVAPLLASLAETLQQGRETADGAARALAGEAVEQPMALGGEPAAGLGTDLGAAPETSDLDSELGAAPEADGFDATDAAAGGEEELGRERR